MKKKPRFFCDNCACEVGNEVKSCPNCGRYFASVRCPNCDYSSDDRMFKNGCPMCGYSSVTPPDTQKPVKKKKQRFRSEFPEHDGLPFWNYIAIAIGLLAIITLLSYFITM